MYTGHYNILRMYVIVYQMTRWKLKLLTTFKNRLGKHWTNRDVLFDFHADITGIGGLPICI